MPRKLLSRFGLLKHPFSKDVPTEELFESKPAEEVLTRLVRTVTWKSSGTLTGEPGTGKTFAYRALESRLPPGRFKLCYIHNSTVKLRDFYRQLSQHLGLEPKATPSALFREIRGHIEEIAAQKQHVVLALDEAHIMPVEVLQHLHILLNFQRDSKPLLSILLMGLPNLRDLLMRNALASLATRLPTRTHLEPLERSQVALYLRHRMRTAGCAEEIFAEDAVLLIAEATCGSMRKIDILAMTALELACEARSKLVDSSVIQDAVKLCAEAIA